MYDIMIAKGIERVLGLHFKREEPQPWEQDRLCVDSPAAPA
jgi:hypothetical protein